MRCCYVESGALSRKLNALARTKMAKQNSGESYRVRELLKRKDKAEALKWLTSSPAGVYRNIGEMTDKESIAYVRRLYRLGAREVVIAELQRNGEYESTNNVVLTLPDDRSARRAIFEFETDRVEEMGFEQDSDTGQKHLWCWFS